MKKLTNIKDDFPGWYQDVIFQSELVDSSPTRGSMVIRPYGYAIWENIQKNLDQKIKELGAQNAYFPLLIPESFLKKEAEHVEGFAPEVAVVTHAGGKKLEEPLVIRPTSETIIYYMFARWIHSWRDLPLKINQWANIVRWEMRPRAFLRTTEFLWQEGHTAHATHQEADEMAKAALAMYKDFVENHLAIPVFSGIKTDAEKFAGAEKTYCIEALMPDGKGLQMGTTHLLAHSFPQSFDINFQDTDGTMKTPFCSSWGVSTRMIGGLLMTHGDQKGLILPPRIAPIQVAIVPIFKEDTKQQVLDAAEKLKAMLQEKNIRTVVDTDETKTPGAKFFTWELKGVPLRIEIGPKDIEKNSVVAVQRVSLQVGSSHCDKKIISIDAVGTEVVQILEEVQKKLFERAQDKQKENTYITGWCGSAECELTLKEDKRSIRCCFNTNKHNACFACKKASITDVLIAKSY
jgi:prolyl-tRNA synthetase